MLSGEYDRTVAVSALVRAGSRFMLVTDDGIEHPTEDDVIATGLYSPNYVADPRSLEDGSVELYVDCKGVIEPAMATTFRRILAEELDVVGVVDAIVRPVTS